MTNLLLERNRDLRGSPGCSNSQGFRAQSYRRDQGDQHLVSGQLATQNATGQQMRGRRLPLYSSSRIFVLAVGLGLLLRRPILSAPPQASLPILSGTASCAMLRREACQAADRCPFQIASGGSEPGGS